ncbi:MAG: small multi-drug export protein [Cellulosilyticum sp.]|nr:small multi-drug export protein [Cellulosilyticum sp.]
MVDSLVNFFTQGLVGIIPSEAIIFIVSMVPVLELRGGLLAASLLDIEMYKAVWICIIGNLIPIPFILLFIKTILGWMKKQNCFKKLVEWLEHKSMSKGGQIEKYEFLGLLLFVGVPLPGTGAWTGALIASLLDVKNKKAFMAIGCGLVMATVIMCFIAYGIPALVTMIA